MSVGLGGRRGFSKWVSWDGKVLVVDSVGEGRATSRSSETGEEIRAGVNNVKVRGSVDRMDRRKQADGTVGFIGQKERTVAIHG
jgi:hypothetical protein